MKRLVLAALLLRCVFYCVQLPLWEGFDEWAHFAYVQHLAENARLPLRTDPIPPAVQRSLELVPLSRSAALMLPGALTHDEYWRRPEPERALRERELLGPGGKYKGSQPRLQQYESQHPPLYYLLLLLPYFAVRSLSLPAQVLALRLASVLMAAAGLLLCSRLAARIPAARRASVPVLVLLSAWPGLLVNLCRIGNDGLALALCAATILLLCRLLSANPAARDWALAGIVLSAALLTKANLLALLPLVPLAAFLQTAARRATARNAVLGCLLTLSLAAIFAGWWYAGTWQATGTLSGEQLDSAAARFGAGAKLSAAARVDWLRVVDGAAATHIWTGAWSFLGVRGWMYRVFEIAGLLAAAGVALLSARIARRLRHARLGDGDARFTLCAAAFGLFALSLAYQSVVIWLASGMSAGLGWYLQVAAGPEMVLLAAGFGALAGVKQAGKCVAAIAILLAVLDLYTVNFISIPYYTGLTAHLPSGSLRTFHLGDLAPIGIAEVLARLAHDRPVPRAAIAALWSAYAAATATLIAAAMAAFSTKPARVLPS